MQYIPIGQTAETFLPKIMSGIMGRNWQKALDGSAELAAAYHVVNHLEIHSALEGISKEFRLPESALCILSAALWAYSQETEARND